MKKKPTCFRWAKLSLPAMFFTVFIFSCQDDEDTPSVVENRGDENRTEISLIEEQTGVSFFKRDLILTDESGDNEVTIRLAGRNESMLDEYLTARMFSIDPIYAAEKRITVPITVPQDHSSTTLNSDTDYESILLVEYVGKKLKEGVIGVRLRNQPNPLYEIDKTGRTQYYSHISYVSNTWPSILALQAFDYIDWFVWYKGRWYQSWSPWFGDTWCCNQFGDIDVDGPYKVRIDIAFNYLSDYYTEFFY